MTSPGSSSLFETFREPTRIRLFGKPFPGLKYDPNPSIEVEEGAETLSDPVDAPGTDEQVAPKPTYDRVARIYGFSFEGHYIKLPRPVLFLVRGAGQPCGPGGGPVGGDGRFDASTIGVESKDWQFGNDIRVWTVERNDAAARLDLELGTYDDVLLQPLAGAEGTLWGPGASRNAASFRTRAVGIHQDR